MVRRIRPERQHALDSLVAELGLRPEQLFSSEYLDWYFDEPDTGYVLDPRNDFNSAQSAAAFTAFGALARATEAGQPQEGLSPLRISVDRDSIVVRLDDLSGLARLRTQHPSLDVGRTLLLQPQWVQAVLLDVETTLAVVKASGPKPLTITVTDEAGQAIAGAKVTLVFDVSRRAGAEVRTNSHGQARLLVPATQATFDSLAIFPRHSFWPYGVKGWTPGAGSVSVTLKSLDDGHHGQFHYLPDAQDSDGTGVKVAVIDGGVGPHPAITVSGGDNLVGNDLEDPAELGSYADNGLGHGTHVAGIIAARPLGPSGMRGIAPGAQVFSYRVMARGKRDAEDTAVASAIDTAVDDGCDLLNLSLGFPGESALIRRAIRRAAARGVVAIAAVGNAGGRPVYYPAATPGVIGVTALGRRSRLPQDTVSSLAYQNPPAGADADDFVGIFSNIGVGVSAAAPGVGIVSCAPGGFYAVEDGTSMAAPVVTGYAARVLGSRPTLLGQARDQNRADAIRAAVLQACDALGFPINYVGNGHPR